MNGLIVLNKPKGMTSFSAVNAIHRLTRTKAGHAGTLDPMAEGVLLVLLGKFTKKAKEFESSIKEYRAEITFGVEIECLLPAGRVAVGGHIKKRAALHRTTAANCDDKVHGRYRPDPADGFRHPSQRAAAL